MNFIKNSNFVISFLLEMVAVFILGYWGFIFFHTSVIQVILGISTPILMVVIWSIWCDPSSTYRLEGIWLIALKILLFEIVAVCLLSLRKTSIAIILIVITALNLGVSFYFETF